MMSKSKSASGAAQGIMNNPFAFSDVAFRAQAYWRAQSLAAEHVQQFVDEWCERRREAAAAAADCCARLFEDGGDPAAAPNVWTAWVTGSVERLQQDFQDQAALATRLAGVMGDALGTVSAPPARPGAPTDRERARERV